MATRFQVDTVLQIMGMSISALGHLTPTAPASTPFEGMVSPPAEKYQPKCPEAHIALENTLRTACDRLEKILQDESRWSTKFQEETETHFREAAQLSKETLTHQRNAAHEITTPHFRYRPTLLRLTDGSWCAFLGNIEQMDQGIIGIGVTAQDAIDAFDDSFVGITNPKVLEWLSKRQYNLETNQTDEPFPTQNNEQAPKTLDPGRDSAAENPNGDNLPGQDSRDPEAERGVSGTPILPASEDELDPITSRKRPRFRRRYGDSGSSDASGASPS